MLGRTYRQQPATKSSKEHPLLTTQTFKHCRQRSSRSHLDLVLRPPGPFLPSHHGSSESETCRAPHLHQMRHCAQNALSDDLQPGVHPNEDSGWQRPYHSSTPQSHKPPRRTNPSSCTRGPPLLSWSEDPKLQAEDPRNLKSCESNYPPYWKTKGRMGAARCVVTRTQEGVCKSC